MRRSAVTLGALTAVCLVAIWFLMRWVAEHDIGVTGSAVLIVGSLVLVVPASRGGHTMLDAHPDRVVAVTPGVDTILTVLFGLAAVEGIPSAMLRPGWRLPIPAELALMLMWLLGPFVALTVVNLALRGLGAPFAAPVSSRLATDRMYRYTRIPMALSLPLFLVAVALWLRSAWCVAWVMGLVAPAWLYDLRIFEERKLELRFGPSYLEYRARTPMLWPTRPRHPHPEQETLDVDPVRERRIPRGSIGNLAARSGFTGALVLSLVAGGPALHAAERVDARVTVDTTAVVRVVDGRFFGLNATIWDEAFAKPETAALLADAGTRVLRFPGGSLSDEYHWKTNTTLSNTWTWATDFDAFARVAVALNSAVYITVNYGSGTPEEAAEWVTYANVTGRYGFKFWEIGNESYGLWETDLQEERHDPYTYAARARDYIAQMKAADPTIRVGVVVITGEDSYVNNLRHPATNPRTGLVHNGWTPVLLATLRSLAVTPEFAIYHRYEQAPGAESDAALLQSARTWADDACDLRQQLTDYLGPAGAGVELVVTENNSVYSDPGKQTTSLVNGLFLADSVGNILQTEFNVLLWWDVRNSQLKGNNNGDALYGWRPYGDYGVISTASTFGSSTSFEPYPTYYVAKLLSHWARGGDLVVRAQSDHTLLSVFAARTNTGSLKLLAINKSPTIALTASFNLGTFDPHRTAMAYSYGIPQDEAARTVNGSGDLASSTLEIPGLAFTATFAPYSVTVLSLQPRDPQRIVRRVLRRSGTP